MRHTNATGKRHVDMAPPGTQFTCLTSTKLLLALLVQSQAHAPYQRYGQAACGGAAQFTTEFTCFTSTKVQIPTQKPQTEAPGLNLLAFSSTKVQTNKY
jgi:hypothetical protein